MYTEIKHFSKQLLKLFEYPCIYLNLVTILKTITIFPRRVITVSWALFSQI